jgi:hypothetical protein
MTFKRFSPADIESAPVAPWQLPPGVSGEMLHTLDERVQAVEGRLADIETKQDNSLELGQPIHLMLGEVGQ